MIVRSKRTTWLSGLKVSESSIPTSFSEAEIEQEMYTLEKRALQECLCLSDVTQCLKFLKGT